MAEVRLSHLDKEFYSSLLREDDAALRRAAYAAAKYATEKNHIKYPAVAGVLALLKTGQPIASRDVAELGRLVINLDNIQVDLKERVKLGRKTETEWKAAFFQARTANAVFQAVNEDPLLAAIESIYEAHAATEDWPALKGTITEALERTA
jgi:hypothetical protein